MQDCAAAAVTAPAPAGAAAAAAKGPQPSSSELPAPSQLPSHSQLSQDAAARLKGKGARQFEKLFACVHLLQQSQSGTYHLQRLR